MGKSYKKHAIIKDKSGYKWYNRTFRRVLNAAVRDFKNLADIETWFLKSPKTIINEYDICDYRWDLEHPKRKYKIDKKYYRK